MTRVLIDLRVMRPDGSHVPADGVTRWRPVVARVHEGHVDLPASFRAAPDATIDVTPSILPGGTVVVAYEVDEAVLGGRLRWVLVPDSADVVAYSDLAEVDPATLEPSPPALAGWEAVLGQVSEQASRAAAADVSASAAARSTAEDRQVVESAADAVGSAVESAGRSAEAAGTSEQAAAESAVTAGRSAEAAASAADAAAESEREAVTAAGLAVPAAGAAGSAAEAAAGSAGNAAASAQAAETAAGAATEAASSATAAAEAVAEDRVAVETAHGLVTDAAQAAGLDAETAVEAAGDAVAARDLAVPAAATATAARDVAVAARDATLAAVVITGEGRPDVAASMSAPVQALVAAATSGAEFRSLDGPQGAWVWRKRGTNWVCVEGDTGWRNYGLSEVQTILPNITASTLRRDGGTVWFRMDGISSVSAMTTLPGWVPSGFRISYSAWMGHGPNVSGKWVLGVRPSSSGHLALGGFLDANSVAVMLSWNTADAWPTSLPGTAA